MYAKHGRKVYKAYILSNVGQHDGLSEQYLQTESKSICREIRFSKRIVQYFF